jgi:voltage-gated potassium channel
MAAGKFPLRAFKRPVTLLRQAGAAHLCQIAVIGAGLIAMAGYTIDDLAPPKHLMFRGVLVACLAFFTVEWMLQVIASARSARPADYWKSGGWIIDAICVLPVPVALSLGIPAVTAWLFGSLWLFKLAIITPGLARLGRVIAIEARPLTSVFIIFLMVLFFSAVLLHLFEREAQPAAFGSLAASLWWATATLTTTGYGDAVPVTEAGRLVAGMVMICGLGVFGLLTGILATGFVDESRREAFVQNWSMLKNVPFFRVLEPAGLIEIARMLRRWDIAEGAVVIRRGREGDCMYFVASGEVEVDIQPPVRLGPDSFFGEGALLGSGVRNATVIATRPSTLLILDAADFRTFTAHHPVLADAIEAEAKRRGGDLGALADRPPASSGRPE